MGEYEIIDDSDDELTEEEAEELGEEFASRMGEDSEESIVVASEVLPEKLIILPLIQRPVFPGMMVPLVFSGSILLDGIKAAYDTEHRVMGSVLAKELSEDNPLESQLYEYGTVLRIHKVIPVSDDTVQVLVQGIRRFKKIKANGTHPFITWEVQYFYEPEEKLGEELRAYTMAIINSVKELLKLNFLFQEQLRILMSHITFEKPGVVMDMIASMTTAEGEKLQEILETTDLIARANKILILLKQEIEVSRLQEKIKQTIEEKISKQQKQFFLNEQLKIIKKELGLEKDDKTAEAEKFQKRVAKLKFSEEAQKVFDEEMDKFRLLEPASPEYHVSRTYLDWLTELPWGVFSEDRLDIAQAKEILDRDHYGLEDVKDRILEFISTASLKGKLSGSIICLVGPPGVGKTSIGRSIADAVNRKFFRFSLGGMRDEAEIKGHRRTYIGAMPGKLLQSLKRTGTANPVIMLDEIDKVGKSFNGDPASALLEVLDPEQNKDFLDHYLDVRFDLSGILFVTTANQLDTIPPALLDRMEIITLSGYILEEKKEIAKRYLIPRQLKDHGLEGRGIEFSEEALVFVIDRYARESGVRNLDNQIKKIMRRLTRKIVENQSSENEIKSEIPVTVTKDIVEEYLGKPVFSDEELYNKDVVGVALGLAWTSMGGATLYIEAKGIMSKNPGLKQTGQLGKVMEESSEIAYSLIRSVDYLSGFFDKNFIHIHVPAGATPKDGPSAGITMALALFSLASGRAVRSGVAMTGELTLTGKVLPIGGVKEKTIAARRAGVFEIILPSENKKDFDELPDHIRNGITVNYAVYFKDVLKFIYGEELDTIEAELRKKTEENKGRNSRTEGETGSPQQPDSRYAFYDREGW